MIGRRVGWGPRDCQAEGTHVIKVLTVPAGSWRISAPVRVQWTNGGPSSGIHVRYGDPDPQPVAYAFNDHLDVPKGQPGQHAVFPIDAFITCTATTTLPVIVETLGDGTCNVVDGDTIRTGEPL